MKQFAVFAYDNYYPSGGMNDFMDSFDNFDDAKTFALKCKRKSGARFDETKYENVEIFDMVNMQELPIK